MVQRQARLRVPADFGLAIQQARMSRGMSQTDLSKELDVSQSAISEIESGKSTIYMQRLLELARLTGEMTATWEDAPSEAEEAERTMRLAVSPLRNASWRPARRCQNLRLHPFGGRHRQIQDE